MFELKPSRNWTKCYGRICIWKLCLFKIYMHKGFSIRLLNSTPIFAQAKVSKLLQHNRYSFNIVIKMYMHVY